ncbi:NCS2 family permease [Oceanobacillus caeni]|uniref:Permease n=1 Tax=Oceanobacillus caeni TaxID=405946 RepID=A0ABR5MM67_9BACI|nr:NCS2 family permease [Oceanobacillus caeni]KPH77457.1 permease [Oceanobacillus caeni]MED4473052.1 NCS2 family permease [Oceanobacillus caeni]
MKEKIKKLTNLSEKGTTMKQEILAGFVSFFTIVYIIAVNSTILADAGIPIQAAVWATILTCVAGCLIMGIWGNLPLILVPGMGVNAMFSYTFVHSMGLTWQEALAVVFIAGLLFVIIAFTPLSDILTTAIPSSLKDSISVGLGLFLALLGLEKSQLVVRGEHSLISLGDISSPTVLAFILTLILAVILFLRNIPANFLITIFVGTIIAWMFGLVDMSSLKNGFGSSSGDYGSVFGAMSFGNIASNTFWIAVFSLTMVLVFENIGLISGQLGQLNQNEKYGKAFRVTSISAVLSGIFGSSPTVSTVETAAGITAGGRTGITSIVTGLLFLLSIFFIPFVTIIPSSAIAPILIIIGGLMLQNVKSINFDDLSEVIPAFFIIIMIPFTYSIADGIAFGFIAYPIAKLVVGKASQVSIPLYIISGLFLLNFILHGV